MEKGVFAGLAGGGTVVAPLKETNNTQQRRTSMPDDRMAPFSTGGFFLVQLALMIPIVNLILLLIFAFAGSVNINLQNYSRAILIWMLVGIGITLIVGVIGALAAGGIGAYLDNISTQYK